ncbi:unnamed protein product [Brugia pahangi]|uniref:Uncharacterized protein n=1 Tax=Brugia pahangi TaxID=6280 RepID=A0A0N4TDT6_BRUPA|nr:unnamed protein product [Brugia pahangi]
MKDYFLQLKKTIYIKLKEAQPDTIDDAIEFQSWTLSILAVIISSFVFICCFIPLLVCLACKLFGCCTCTGCRTNDGLTRRYIFWQNSAQKRLSNEHRKQNGNIRNNILKVEFYKSCHKRAVISVCTMNEHGRESYPCNIILFTNLKIITSK